VFNFPSTFFSHYYKKVQAIITLDPTTPNTIVISIHTPPQLIIMELGSKGQSFDVHNQALEQ
jgi:hypothetical protein